MSLDPGRGTRFVLIDATGADPRRHDVGELAAALGLPTPVFLSAAGRGRFAAALAGEAAKSPHGGLILTFGLISCGPGDWVPEATTPLLTVDLPALPTALRLAWTARHAEAFFFRNVAGLIGPAVVVNLPAEAELLAETAAFLARVLPHAVEKAAGSDRECSR